MAQLMKLTVSMVCLASAAYADDFSAEPYFCGDTPSTLSTYGEAVDATAYFFDLRTGIAPFDLEACSGMRLQMAMMIADMQDPAMIGPSLVGIARSHLGRQMALNAFEQRYAGDIDIMLQLSLTCTVIQAQDAACLVDTIKALPDIYLESSPVFCDFAQTDVLLTPSPDPIATEDTLPLLCGAVRTDQAWDGVSDWLVEAHLREIVPNTQIAAEEN